MPWVLPFAITRNIRTDPKHILNKPNLKARYLYLVVEMERAPMTTQDSPLLSWFGNIASGVTIVTTLFGILPALAAGVALVWYVIQIYESTTVQRWLAGRRMRKIARLKARVLMMESHVAPMPSNMKDL